MKMISVNLCMGFDSPSRDHSIIKYEIYEKKID